MVLRSLFLLFLSLNLIASAQPTGSGGITDAPLRSSSGVENMISGRITDSKGNPIPFASVYTADHKFNAVANERGYYKISLSPGGYVLVFNSIGYKQRELSVLLKKSIVINVELEADIYKLDEITVTSGKDDPAYEIIRKVIEKRKIFQDEAPDYVCDVYVRGVQKLISAPKKILGQNVANTLGLDSRGQAILYQSETRSKIYSRQSAKKEVMLASKIAGDNKGFSFNRALELQINFYNNLLHWEPLGNSNFISPIAENALHFYKYKLVGSSEINDRTVYKIQVIPKSKHSPVFSGDLYILKDDWRLYSVDLLLTSDARINFVDTLQINQQFAEVSRNVWKQSDITLRFKGKVLGFEFDGYFIGLNSNYQLNPDIADNFFNHEILSIPADVNKNEASYWIKNRPSPLSTDELVNYYVKDSLEAKKFV